MTSLVDVPDTNFGEWHFRLLGTPVRVQPWFWLMVLLLGAQQETGAVAIWVLVCFLSVLVHEFGHVLALRAFGYRSEVIFYGWGGLTLPQRRSYSHLRSWQQILIALSGPLAGFALAVLVCMLALAAHAEVRVGIVQFMPSLTAILPSNGETGVALRGLIYKNVLLNDLLFVNFYWGLVNLLPIYPLDGGRVTRALFEESDPRDGFRRSLLLSGICAAIMALLGVARKDMYMVLVFGLLAATSLQSRDAAGSRRR